MGYVWVMNTRDEHKLASSAAAGRGVGRGAGRGAGQGAGRGAGERIGERAESPSRAAELRAARWLAKGDLRPTRQRLALAWLLVGDGRNRHVTADSLFEAAARAGHKVSLATVYNTLRSFTGAGLVTEITVDGSRSYFDTDVSDHPHFFWEEEGRLSDAPPGSVRFEHLPEAPEGAEIARVDVVVRLRQR